MTDAERVIEEIRESRRRMSEQCGHDPGKLIEYLQTFNRKYVAQVAEFERAQPTSLPAKASP